MSSETEIDGRQATKLVQQYFTEQYGVFGVNVFEVVNAEYDKNEKRWTVRCSFYRTLLGPQKSVYEVVVYLDGRIGSVTMIEGLSR